MNTPSPTDRTLVALAIVSLASSAGALGPLSTTSTRMGAAVLLALVAVGSAAGARRPRWPRLLAALAVGAAAFLVLPRAGHAALAVLACAAGIEGCAAIASWAGRTVGGLRAAAAAGLVLGLLETVVARSPRAWNAIFDATQDVTRALGAASGAGTVLGPSVAGLEIVVLVVAYVVLQVRGGPGRLRGAALALAWTAAIAAIAGAAGVPLLLRAFRAVSGVLAVGADSMVPGWPASVAVWLPAALLAALLPPVALLAAGWHDGGDPPRRPALRRLCALAAAGAGLGLAWLPADRLPGDGVGRRVVLRDAGMVDWRTPSPQVLGLERSGMFGLLPRYLRAAGFTAEVRRDALDPAVLRGAHVVAIFNPTERVPARELRALREFVEGGGGLVVFGDHTDLQGIKGPLDAIAGPYGVTFRFDSAFTPHHWRNDAAFHPAAAVRDLDDGNSRFQQSTGASLALRGGAAPIATARWGFSDAGDRENEANAFLGDYIYQAAEPLGDLPVVAQARAGRGRVLVFGDTSGFQNVAMPLSWPFVLRTFQTAAAEPIPGARAAATAGLLLFLLGGAIALLWPASAARAAFLGGALVAVALAASARAVAEPQALPLRDADLAIVDAAHLNDVSMDLWEERSLNGLQMNLARNGLLPVVDRAGDPGLLAHARVFVTVCPRRAFDERELAALRRFAEGGGEIVVATGWEERDGAGGLLALAGLDVGPVPLGPVPLFRKIDDPQVFAMLRLEPHFAEAWAIEGVSSHRDEVLYAAERYPIVVRRPMGSGGMTLIADPFFLMNRTLEEEGAAWEGNILFLRRVLRSAPELRAEVGP